MGKNQNEFPKPVFELIFPDGDFCKPVDLQERALGFPGHQTHPG